MTHSEERLRFDDGAETTLERWGDGQDAILCVHGMTGSRKAWDEFAQHYGDRFRVYAYDQRGHGSCSHVAGPMTLHRSLLDLHNVAGAVPGGIETLIGHSWGGAVAILGGRRFDVRRVVAIDPMIRQASSAWYARMIRDLKKQRAATDVIRRLRDDNPPEKWDLRRDLEGYPKPLYLPVGEGSESMLTLDDLKFIRDRAGPNVSLRVFEGHGHNPHRTAFDRFASELDAFLQRV